MTKPFRADTLLALALTGVCLLFLTQCAKSKATAPPSPETVSIQGMIASGLLQSGAMVYAYALKNGLSIASGLSLSSGFLGRATIDQHSSQAVASAVADSDGKF